MTLMRHVKMVFIQLFNGFIWYFSENVPPGLLNLNPCNFRNIDFHEKS